MPSLTCIDAAYPQVTGHGWCLPRPPYSLSTSTRPTQPSVCTESHARHRHDGCPPPIAPAHMQNAQPQTADAAPHGHGPGSG